MNTVTVIMQRGAWADGRRVEPGAELTTSALNAWLLISSGKSTLRNPDDRAFIDAVPA